MNYILCHKDIPVLRFSTEDEEISEVSEIINREHLPIGISPENEKGKTLKSQFRSWWKSRSIPASRQNLDTALEQLGNVTTDYLIEKSYGLSLSDHYWAKPLKSSLSWKDVNFFQNSFSDDVGKALFGVLNSDSADTLNLVSPDNTSDGWLKKKWIINNGERIILKAGTAPYYQEPFNEVLTSEICGRLGIEHVEYKIIKNDGTFYSSCPDFVSPQTELVPAWHIVNTLKKNNSTSNFNHLINCCKELGFKDTEKLKQGICRMLTVDFIIANTDRHYNNFGFLRNPDTLEWSGLAPVFDSGTSFFHSESVFSLKNPYLRESLKIKAKPFASNQKEQMQKIPFKKYCTVLDFERLNGVSEFFGKLISQNPYIEPERAEILCKTLDSRIKETERLFEN